MYGYLVMFKIKSYGKYSLYENSFLYISNLVYIFVLLLLLLKLSE